MLISLFMHCFCLCWFVLCVVDVFFLHQQSADEGGVSTICGAVSTQGDSVFVPGLFEYRCMEVFMIRGWGLVVPGCGGTTQKKIPPPLGDRNVRQTRIRKLALLVNTITQGPIHRFAHRSSHIFRGRKLPYL